MCSDLSTLGEDHTHKHKEAKQHFSTQASLRDSLLDAVENQDATTWFQIGVCVVIQRVYYLPFKCQQSGDPAVPPSSDSSRVR